MMLRGSSTQGDLMNVILGNLVNGLIYSMIAYLTAKK